MRKIGVVVVTHNSQAVLGKNMECLCKQTRPADEIVIVDSGSNETEYLAGFQAMPNVRVIREPTDVGFCRGNNLAAVPMLGQFEYILFLNPDAFLPESFLAEALEFMSRPENARVGIMTGTLLGYDIQQDQATGRIDSAGIFRNWYGRWYDRGHGQPARTFLVDRNTECVPAVCGALMFCRSRALKDSLVRADQIWDEDFFMWKDDVDLSLRIRRAGWTLMHVPQIIVYHCRGWYRDRSKMPKSHRVLAARNDIRLCVRNRSPYLVYALMKYLYVRFRERP